ncbi:hypothetical protein EHI8A_179990 [Entamoeba histolytica HM-1:IMSS-B]|uniref:Uncharacterized protein n=5 Tax=Entamoeba histolytica TaxID=5759 RepID=B1N317_ENTH1|nr:hypothetical protein EHI_008060 [Entamoeba histolytica HM-1:IMSS]EMH73875.1 hypothetical protein EHI8A_179990 [Entamoeba histolytica HM-1:IMSS-B]EMS11152.1 hypothetical protein KM1_247840 [Entamoeba histolytica HM-3:IMSS]ENY62012.1 hypothetical protein EHI7A_156610 [Entamoeba histolytica HM-1:IMSS-A]GAT93835.1 hypothetical protein CL6EHI_008060 [Entamoeba histolytica]EDS89645.1 hypothetical protein EHI_008060 [Entamoeba histolytica HM-1:IMSS]|eukprot:XP_001913583.1 hypothetical protein EHI_008060 [Entamoeba histolytica HM-1:IMSS]
MNLLKSYFAKKANEIELKMTLEDRIDEIIELDKKHQNLEIGIAHRSTRLMAINIILICMYFFQLGVIGFLDYSFFNYISIYIHLMIYVLEFLLLFILMFVCEKSNRLFKKEFKSKVNNEILLQYKVDELSEDTHYESLTKIIKKYSIKEKKRKLEIEQKVKEKLIRERNRINEQLKDEYSKEYNKKLQEMRKKVEDEIRPKIEKEFREQLIIEQERLKQKTMILGRRVILSPSILEKEGETINEQKIPTKENNNIKNKTEKSHSVDFAIVKPKIERLTEIKKRNQIVKSLQFDNENNNENDENISQNNLELNDLQEKEKKGSGIFIQKGNIETEVIRSSSTPLTPKEINPQNDKIINNENEKNDNQNQTLIMPKAKITNVKCQKIGDVAFIKSKKGFVIVKSKPQQIHVQTIRRNSHPGDIVIAIRKEQQTSLITSFLCKISGIKLIDFYCGECNKLLTQIDNSIKKTIFRQCIHCGAFNKIQNVQIKDK